MTPTRTQRVCPACGVTFPRLHKRVYCLACVPLGDVAASQRAWAKTHRDHLRAYNAARRKPAMSQSKACTECGSSFDTLRPTVQLACSRACRLARKARLARESRHRRSWPWRLAIAESVLAELGQGFFPTVEPVHNPSHLARGIRAVPSQRSTMPPGT